jgi:hypothetical protein
MNKAIMPTSVATESHCGIVIKPHAKAAIRLGTISAGVSVGLIVLNPSAGLKTT